VRCYLFGRLVDVYVNVDAADRYCAFSDALRLRDRIAALLRQASAQFPLNDCDVNRLKFVLIVILSRLETCYDFSAVRDVDDDDDGQDSSEEEEEGRKRSSEARRACRGNASDL